MALNTTFGTSLQSRPWVMESAVAVLGLLSGVALLPALIFYGGAATLGRYEGASLGNLYHSVFAGLREGSLASWAVFLGPYALYLLFRALRLWWSAGANGA
jgi:hypothetical protein